MFFLYYYLHSPFLFLFFSFNIVKFLKHQFFKNYNIYISNILSFYEHLQFALLAALIWIADILHGNITLLAGPFVCHEVFILLFLHLGNLAAHTAD